MIGSLGDIVFEVSSKKVRTLDELQRSGSARVAYHARQGGKELAEFLGPGLESISFDATFSASLGVNPTAEAEALRDLRDNGKAVLFILDGSPQGDGYWLVESLSEEHRYLDNRGRSLTIVCTVTLKEYLPRRD